jgi:hypothetical protein
MELVFAYIDPGSGSLVIQALIAGIVAIPILFRRQVARVVRALRGTDEPAPDGPGGHEDASPRR